MSEIGGGWYMEKISKRISPLRRPKLGKKSQEKEDHIKNYMKLIGIIMIGNSNYIGTILNGFLQEVKSKGNNPI